MKRFLIIVLFFTLSVGASNAASYHHITPADVAKLKQAIEDEIYDYGYYNEFYQIGEDIGTSQHWVARARLYINPVYNSVDKHGEVIYKLMPYGQVYRVFYIDKDGDIELDGNPQNHFPVTQPSHQTVFMDEEDVRRYEQAWMKTSFVVDIGRKAFSRGAVFGEADPEGRGLGKLLSPERRRCAVEHARKEYEVSDLPAGCYPTNQELHYSVE